MKNDQEGDRQKDARNIYANSVMPEVCSILSLGIYFSVLGFSRESVRFPGAEQHDQYSKVPKRGISLPAISDCLTRAGLNSNDFGSHSARKRAATVVSSCSGGGPSSASICLRAGWTLPGVQDSYVRYKAAEGQVVVRYVSGLPFEISSFAILSPLFRKVDEIVRAAVQVCFPSAPSNMNTVCEFLLASLVYHVTYLKTTLPLSHLMFETVLFRDVELLSKLQEKMICRLSSPIDRIIATGIPPHVGMLVAIKAQNEKIETLVDTIAGIVPRAVDSVSAALEKHSSQANLISKADISTAVAGVLQQSGIGDCIRQIHSPSTYEVNLPPPISASEETTPFNRSCKVLSWGGSFHRVPRDFEFPQRTVAIAWEHWCYGTLAKKYPPVRMLRLEIWRPHLRRNRSLI